MVAAVGSLVVRETSLDAVLSGTARLLSEAMSADGCLVYRVGDGGEVAVAASFPPRTGAALRLPGGFGVTGRVAADQVPAVLVDDNPRNPLHRELLGLAEGQLVSRLCVPAREPRGRCAAVLAVHMRAHREFTWEEVVLASQVADLVGLRVELDRSSVALAGYERGWDAMVDAAVEAQETERRRVAGDLHDGVTQTLASLTFHLSAAEMAVAACDFDDAATQVHTARTLADLAFAETRSAISGLHSPVLDDLGLAAGLASMARAVPTLQVDVDAADLELPDHVEAALFRIAQEAVQNVVKHAHASHARVQLAKHGRSAVLTVSDDGRGFDASLRPSGSRRDRTAVAQYGLAGMSERVQLLGGELSIASEPGEGTTVRVRVPDVLS
ncbi:MAG: ATP-binding protein [Jatrophihabitans sp.]